MNSKKICKVAGVFFIFGIFLVCLSIYYESSYQKIDKKIDNEINKMTSNKMPRPYIERYTLYTEWKNKSKENATLAMELSNARDTFECFRNLSIATIVVSLLLFLFCLALHMKRKVEKSNKEQRMGFLLTVSSPVMSFISLFIYGIIEERNVYEENPWLIVGYITIFAIGIAMYFNIFSSVIEWVKFGKEKNKP